MPPWLKLRMMWFSRTDMALFTVERHNMYIMLGKNSMTIIPRPTSCHPRRCTMVCTMSMHEEVPHICALAATTCSALRYAFDFALATTSVHKSVCSFRLK